jgi:protein-disulfide isomerase
MTRSVWIAAVATAAIFSAAAVADAQGRKTAPAAKPAVRDWARVVSITPEGGFRMGNPDARVKLVEYGSLTCPTCARFSNEAKAALAARVRIGKVSFEFRNYVLNGLDLGAALLARCGGPSRFFPLTEDFYATQPQWTGKVTGMTQAQKDQLQKLPADRQIGRIAEIGGLTRMAAAAGVTPQQASACLSDKGAVDRLVQMRQAGDAAGVHGTPTFFINGAAADAHDWAGLLPAIQKAGG